MTLNEAHHDWIRMIRAEYLEFPGLVLTKRQVQRLWGLEETICDVLLDAMVAEKFLRKNPRDAYIRADSER